MKRSLRIPTVAVGVAISALACLILAPACHDDSSLVGGECALHYTQCQNECVDLSSDPQHCGSCAHACSQGQVCTAGKCAEGPPDASSDGANDGNIDGPLEDGSSDSSSEACPPPPYDNADHCGDCFTQCTGVNDTCVQGTDLTYSCVPFCASPDLTHCDDACVDVQTDENNCGVCSRVCQSNICIGGVCQGSFTGHIVYLGHDYEATPPNTAQANELANALAMGVSTPIRILEFEKYATAAAVRHVQLIGGAMGRDVAFTASSDADEVQANLVFGNYDVFLVYDQATAPSSSTLSDIGTQWATTIATFTHVGGVFITLDGAGGVGGMPAFETATGQLTVGSSAAITDTTTIFFVAAQNDTIGLGVIATYGFRANSVFLSGVSGSSVTKVVVDNATKTLPNVIHRIAP